MKFCQKCISAISEYFGISYIFPIVPEFECEFWAHKELNKRHAALEKLAEAVGGKDKLEALIASEAVRRNIGL